MGDTGDDICGLPGWGKKTAFKYVAQYGNLSNIMNELKTKEKRSKVEETFVNSQELLDICYKLKQMYEIDVPEMEDCGCEEKPLYEFFEKFGFNSLVKDLYCLI